MWDPSPVELGWRSRGWDAAMWPLASTPAVVSGFKGSVQPWEADTISELIFSLVISFSFGVGLRTCGRMMQFWYQLETDALFPSADLLGCFW